MDSRHLPQIDIYADTADLTQIAEWAACDWVGGFTTNPSLARKAGVSDYAKFGKLALEAARGKPVSFEVVSDHPTEMAEQARKIAEWGDAAWIKIPCVHADGVATTPVIDILVGQGIKINVTAIFTLEQAARATHHSRHDVPMILSVFAGRLADTGYEPATTIKNIRQVIGRDHHAKILWASCRELANLWQAAYCGADIITLFPEMLAKIDRVGLDRTQHSVETVRQFLRDAEQSGLTL